jgi:hypothetical protein
MIAKPRFPALATGALLTTAELRAAAELNRSITSSYTDIDAAHLRVESVVRRGLPPRDLRVERLSLGVA